MRSEVPTLRAIELREEWGTHCGGEACILKNNRRSFAQLAQKLRQLREG